MHEQWQRKTERVTRIIRRLADAYRNHAHDFTWSRYGEMKKMVKAAVRDYKVLSVEQLVAAKTRANRTSNIAQETSDVDDVPAGK